MFKIELCFKNALLYFRLRKIEGSGVQFNSDKVWLFYKRYFDRRIIILRTLKGCNITRLQYNSVRLKVETNSRKYRNYK